MKKNNDRLDELFGRLEDQWDIHEPDVQHYDRFIAKQKRKRGIRRYWKPISIAASILLLAGIFILFKPVPKNDEFVFASKETRQTDSIFTAMIRMELQKVQQKQSPLNKKIIADALIQMQILDNDYEKIKQELIRNGENQQIIHAMIRNLQTRISFLENVLQHLENTEDLKNTTDEKTT